MFHSQATLACHLGNIFTISAVASHHGLSVPQQYQGTILIGRVAIVYEKYLVIWFHTLDGVNQPELLDHTRLLLTVQPCWSSNARLIIHYKGVGVAIKKMPKS